METQNSTKMASVQARAMRYARIAWLFIEFIFDRVVDLMGENVRIMRQEGELFFGIALLILGVFNFQSGKYCDGNISDYISCTRPSTYYYYGGFEIFLILVGAFFLMFWILKRQQRA